MVLGNMVISKATGLIRGGLHERGLEYQAIQIAHAQACLDKLLSDGVVTLQSKSSRSVMVRYMICGDLPTTGGLDDGAVGIARMCHLLRDYDGMWINKERWRLAWTDTFANLVDVYNY